MSENQSRSSEEKKQETKIPRRKASTGAWWKSTVVEEIEPPSPPSLPETPDTGSADTGSSAEDVSEDAAPSQKSGRDKTGDRKRQPGKRPGRPPKIAKQKQAEKQDDAVATTVGTETAALPDDDVAKTEKQAPKRKRGRPRKKKQPQQEPQQSIEGTEDVSGGEKEPAFKKKEAKDEQPLTEEAPSRADTKTKDDATGGSHDAALAEDGQSVQDQQFIDGEPPQQSRTERGKPAASENDQSKGKGKQQEQQPAKQSEDVPENRPVIKLLINAEEPEECRLALLEDGRLESIHVATSTRTQTKNNIYKAKIVAIEPNLQAAFVDYGTEKNGFLPFSEIHPEYYKQNVPDNVQKLIDQHQWKKLSITDVMERGREVLVQVVKEEVGKKGANMTTYLSLPGRCVVLMPGSDSTGISRKIVGEEKRTQLRDHMLAMGIPEGIGWIVRTASVDITKAALGRDVSYLLKLWEDVKRKGQELEGVGLIYQDHDHVLRFLREHFDPDIQEILVDDEDALEQVKGFIELLPAKQRKVRCKLHRGARPIFNQYSIEDQIESIYQPKVNLPSGGSIVIDPTEALVSIDVNSGSTQKGKNFEDTIFQANMEAATELARQLRLRDLGGLIVVDFIDMRAKKNIREVEKQVKSAMKRDKAKVDISRISKFGLMQISRQKLGAPIEAGNYRVCSCCKGRGVVRSVETLALFYLRRIHTAASRKMVVQIECRFPLDMAGYLLNNKRNELRDLEQKYNTEVMIIADPSYDPGDHDIVYHKSEK